MLSEAMKAEGWIEHHGGECPIKGIVGIQVLIRAGIQGVVLPQAIGWVWGMPASTRGEIVAYKPEATHD